MLAACGHGSGVPLGRPSDLGPAPAIELPAVADGQPAVSLAARRGTPVIVNFWSSSCVPCRTETPALEAAHRKTGGRVAFVGVDEEDVKADAQAALRAWGATYPSAYDRDGVLADGYRLVGLPTTVLVGADGRMRLRHTGPLDEKAIAALVKLAAA
ncbi:MAG: alkyl hydroperoxide reductase/Thiol specific antioxidant/Mal allergen [Acidimicrobiales bacterium]|jgi:cytochrome c biogenesis protein CcmG/thiol:disulfide interchange protein DsbE|nr:alkyl hydroperoxide reductase/Thiol specific antioxidant/Mal allergen [Acidimicrobiales bacterium]